MDEIPDLEVICEGIPQSEPEEIKEYRYLVNDLADSKLRSAKLSVDHADRVGYDVAAKNMAEAREKVVKASCKFNQWLGHGGERRFRAEYQKLVGDYNSLATTCQEKGIVAELIEPRTVGLY